MERLDLPITLRQLTDIQAIVRARGLTDEAVHEETQRLYGRTVHALTRREASQFIDRLMARRPSTEDTSP